MKRRYQGGYTYYQRRAMVRLGFKACLLILAVLAWWAFSVMFLSL